MQEVDFAIRNFKDESFVQQYLSPKVIRDLHLFTVHDDPSFWMLEITEIHDDEGYRAIRNALSSQYRLSDNEPDIQVVKVDTKGDRSMTLRYTRKNNRPLNQHAGKVLEYAKYLWGFDVHMETVDEGSR